ncbi:MAG: hypothetical protein AAF661_16240 [Pseudomonadota bacterium]
MKHCDYCGGRAPDWATRCEGCGAAITAAAPASTSARSFFRWFADAWRDWPLHVKIFVGFGLLCFAPIVLWFAFMFSVMAIMLVFTAPWLLIFAIGGSVWFWRWRAGHGALPGWPFPSRSN